MRVADAQVRKLMSEFQKHGKVEKAGLAAGMSRNTAAKYLSNKKLPSELVKPRAWRTRPNPFAEEWPTIVSLLEALPEIEVQALFDHLRDQDPGRYQDGQLRTLQRQVRQWRAKSGPPKEVFFTQAHRPGEAMQTDFTWGTSLGVTILGKEFPHMLCHSVLPYSNWNSATVCQSESMLAIKRGVQFALARLGRAPQYHQTDNSTAATHKLSKADLEDRGFNKEYEDFVDHYSMTPRTIAIGKSNQNGDIEASNGVLKRRLKQRLLLRRSSDFESVDQYEDWVQNIIELANMGRADKLNEELKQMSSVPKELVPEFNTLRVKVLSTSTIRIKKNSYSVPARLIGEELEVRVFDDRIEAYYSGELQLRAERLIGNNKHKIDYRHIIWSLVRKPWAFARCRYREELFPSLVFRQVYDQLKTSMGNERKADMEYLRLLHLAASTKESEVELALVLLLESGGEINQTIVQSLVSPIELEVPDLDIKKVDLAEYDVLIEMEAS